jgi:hypothetical protein
MPSVPARVRRRRRDQPPDAAPGQVGELVASAADESGSAAERRAALAGLTRALGSSARSAGVRAVTAGRWLADVLTDAAPRIPVRSAAALYEQHPGLTADQIADSLVKQSSRVTAAFGAAAGGLATMEFAAPPALLAAPVQLAAETLAIAAVEIKLVAELHEIYGQGPAGNLAERGSAYLMSWVRQRAVDQAVAGTGLAAVLGHAAKRELRSRLLRRLGRSGISMAPLLAGAVAGAEVNRRTTRALGEKVTAELRGRQLVRHR